MTLIGVNVRPARYGIFQSAGFLCILYMILFNSCSPARYVPEGDYLLNKNKVEASQKTIADNQLKSYIVQRPNKKLLGVRFYLFLYNMSNLEKEKWPHNWLRRIGEEPVIYSPEMTLSTVERLDQFLENKGYYNAEVIDTVTFQGKNAKVAYSIIPGQPYTIRTIKYEIRDTAVASLILADTVNSLLERGMVFDKDILQEERSRIENLLKEEGYFRFSKEYIYYQADEVESPPNTFDLTMRIEDFIEGNTVPSSDFIPHPKYTIGNIYIYPNISSPENANASLASQPYDTLVYDDQFFLYKGRLNLKPSVVSNASYLIPGQFYRLSNVNSTYRNLSELGLVRYTNIAFVENDGTTDLSGQHMLDCRIELTQKKIQSYQIEPVGTITDGDMGVRGNLLYQNLNLFRGSEIFNLGFTGAIEALKNRTNRKFSSMKEIGVETGIVFPKFLSPFRLKGFVRRYSPRTSISASYNYQSRPDYTRSIANGSFSYRWNASQYVTHTFWPFELNYVQIYEDRSDRDFIDSVRNTPIGYSFEDHMINTAGYSLQLNNQQIGQSRDFIYLRLNLESAGNFVNVFHTIFSGNEEEYPRQVLNVPYFQYLRGDVDLRYYNVRNIRNTLVYRFYFGMGYSYGNSASLPYEKRFFSGGPNSLRAWSTRDVGPGSYVETSSDTSIFNYANKTGDIKLEANLEYRFKVVWKMEGALFLDAGNIWALHEEENRVNASFKWNRFYKEIAVGTGFGFRFDFSFFVLRLDFGLKLHDPALPENERWIPVLKDFSLSDLHLKFGIGYPF